jgi:hypothetical protein
MDSYSQRIDAALVLICSLRGFIGLKLALGQSASLKKTGYEGAFNICTGIVAALMVLGVVVYLTGAKIWAMTQKVGPRLVSATGLLACISSCLGCGDNTLTHLK